MPMSIIFSPPAILPQKHLDVIYRHNLITQYYNQGYYLTIEVKGATPGNQHWVAITGVNGNNVNIVDTGSNGTDLWSSYEWSKSSQFNYFMVN